MKPEIVFVLHLKVFEFCFYCTIRLIGETFHLDNSMIYKMYNEKWTCWFGVFLLHRMSQLFIASFNTLIYTFTSISFLIVRLLHVGGIMMHELHDAVTAKK